MAQNTEGQPEFQITETTGTTGQVTMYFLERKGRVVAMSAIKRDINEWAKEAKEEAIEKMEKLQLEITELTSVLEENKLDWL